MSRPTPRKSSLAGSTPVAPPSPQREAVSKKTTPEAPAPKKGTRPKVAFYQDPEDTERLRGAVLQTMVLEGHTSMSEFISRAVMTEVTRLEKKYNNGQPFPAIGAGGLPQGRPIGQ